MRRTAEGRRSTRQAADGKLEPPEVVEVHVDVGLVARLGRRRGKNRACVGQVSGERVLAGPLVLRRVGEVAVLEAHLVQAQGRLDRTVVVLPQTRRRLEDVVAEQAPTVTGHEPDRLDDVVGDDVGDEVVEVDAHPAGLDSLAAASDLALELVGALEVDAEQVVAVGAGARTAAAGLDAEEVVEDGHDEVVVQVALALAVFFFNDTAPTEIYTLSLHDALPIFGKIERELLSFPVGKIGVEKRAGPG